MSITTTTPNVSRSVALTQVLPSEVTFLVSNNGEPGSRDFIEFLDMILDPVLDFNYIAEYGTVIDRVLYRGATYSTDDVYVTLPVDDGEFSLTLTLAEVIEGNDLPDVSAEDLIGVTIVAEVND